MLQPVFSSSFWEQKRTIETLIEESRTDGDYYLYLSAAAFITSIGLSLGNTVVVIGGMLVAPLLFPLLSLGMGITTSSKDAIMRSLRNLGRSAAIVVGIAWITTWILNNGQSGNDVLIMATTPHFTQFLVAFTSGIVAAFAWARQDSSASLPGVAVAVSLIPPLAAVGYGIAEFSREIISGGAMVFIMNLLGIVLACMIVFSLFGFSQMQKIQERKLEEEQEKINEERAKKEAEAELKKAEEDKKKKEIEEEMKRKIEEEEKAAGAAEDDVVVVEALSEEEINKGS